MHGGGGGLGRLTWRSWASPIRRISLPLNMEATPCLGHLPHNPATLPSHLASAHEPLLFDIPYYCSPYYNTLLPYYPVTLLRYPITAHTFNPASLNVCHVTP